MLLPFILLGKLILKFKLILLLKIYIWWFLINYYFNWISFLRVISKRFQNRIDYYKLNKVSHNNYMGIVYTKVSSQYL
jgi:hypothetical protein